MLEHILRLLILLPIVGGMAQGSLWLWKRVQMGVPLGGGASRIGRSTLSACSPSVRGRSSRSSNLPGNRF